MIGLQFRFFTATMLCGALASQANAGSGTISVLDAGSITRIFDVITDAGGNFISETGICDQAAAAYCAQVTSSHELLVTGSSIASLATLGSIANPVLAAESGTWSINALGAIVNALPAGSATIGAVLQASPPWTVNPGTPANWAIAASAAALPANEIFVGTQVRTSEQAVQTSGSLGGLITDAVGKLIISPYANKENMVRGAASATIATLATLIAAGSGGQKNYITGIQCLRSDTGTTALTVLFNDTAATEMVLPNNGGGGGFVAPFPVPLVTATNTALTFSITASVSTVFCNAQGYLGV